MKKTFTTLLFTLALFTSFSQDATGIIFETGEWKDVLKTAKKENKPIFIDAYTTWCGPCKWMAKNTFTDSAVGAYVNANFVPYKMDMEKGEGIDFAKKHKVRVYPTLLFFNSKGALIHKGIGAKNPEQLLALCSDALNPEEQLATFQEKFEAGERSPEFLMAYMEKKLAAYEDARDAFDIYWAGVNEEDKVTEDNLKLIREVSNGLSNSNDPLLVFVNENKDGFKTIMGEQEFNEFWFTVYRGLLWKTASIEDEAERTESYKSLPGIFAEFSTEIEPYFNYFVALKSKDEVKIAATKSAYLNITSDWQILNSEAWTVYEKASTADELEQGLEWATRSVNHNPNYMNMDTKGALLFKLEKYTEAKTVLQAAINLAAEGEDVEATKALILQIEEKLID